MSRQIRPESSGNGNTYSERLVKLIPSEIITAYVTLSGMITQGIDATKSATLLYIIIGILFVLTPFYLKKFMGVKSGFQLSYTTLGFLIWAFAVKPPIATIADLETTFLASIALILYTMIIPFVYKGENGNNP